MNKNTETTKTTTTRKPRKDKGTKRGAKPIGKAGIAPVVNGIKGIASVPAPKKVDKAQASVDRVNKKIAAVEGKSRLFCCCGCGSPLTSKRPKAFLQGHDARFVGIVQRTVRNRSDLDSLLAKVNMFNDKQEKIIMNLLAVKGMVI